MRNKNVEKYFNIKEKNKIVSVYVNVLIVLK